MFSKLLKAFILTIEKLLLEAVRKKNTPFQNNPSKMMKKLIN